MQLRGRTFCYTAIYPKGWLVLGIVKMFLFPCLKTRMERNNLMLAIYIAVTLKSNSIKGKTNVKCLFIKI